ncbi:RagB/SusD family nutrient uptake outer membrane protein [Sphingobacterium prati]|uniref:RagB/SusD family nutrient uptake outer membrane protein n=1 Tax=Sphingobacterium prati TaxID=2737006 RepID=UPI001553A922|nr:RagB/SusD family nutrient uptake outer membrane protein [Sphingobacterium prati]NPE46766.1 RagB/SusD family nutrient uptake outer membrane protein [Sphingobacterium prati]
MKKRFNILMLAFMLALNSCDKYLDNTPLPLSVIPSESLYQSDKLVASVVNGIFVSTTTAGAFSGPTFSDMVMVSGMFTDELRNLVPGNNFDVFYKNNIQPENSPFWNDFYGNIYIANAALEGIQSTSANLQFKEQWLGECYFMRAFLYYHLVNFYGGVPLAVTSDYRVNNRLSRSSEELVFKQIIADLKLAKNLLSDGYRDGSGNSSTKRVRPNKAAATALLARAYLYAGQWQEAENEATEVIQDANYALESLNKVFLAGSKETIWSLANGEPKTNAYFKAFNNGMPAVLTGNQTPGTFNIFGVITDQLYASFEPADERLNSWVRTVKAEASATRPETIYHLPNKYSSNVNDAELTVPLRLAEQYLIRAEARAHSNKNTAWDDLNIVRKRAGLAAIQTGDIMVAIAQERRVELFTESGHRFFDLKRTKQIDQVMQNVSPLKQSNWKSYMALWPIPNVDLFQNPNLTPNPGYGQ